MYGNVQFASGAATADIKIEEDIVDNYNEPSLDNNSNNDDDDDNNDNIDRNMSFNHIVHSVTADSIVTGKHIHFCEFCLYNPKTPTNNKIKAFRMQVHAFMEEPMSSKAAQIWSMIILLAITVSIITFILQSFRQIEDWDGWFVIETIIICLFTIEYIARVCCVRNVIKFIIKPLNLIDLLAIIPYFIEIAGGSDSIQTLRVFRVVRLARVIRVFKLSRYSSYTQVVINGFLRSTSAFKLMVFWLLLAVIISSSLIYYAERGASRKCAIVDGVTFCRSDGLPSPFTSVIESFYWSMITLCTIGYGAVYYPIEPIGKVVASGTALCGILVIALPITVLGSNFEIAYNEFRQKESVKKVLNTYRKKKDTELATFQQKFMRCLQIVKKKRETLQHSFGGVRRLIEINAKLRAEKHNVKITTRRDLQLWQIVEASVIRSLDAIEKFSATIDVS